MFQNLVKSEHPIYRLNRLGFNAYHNPEEIHNGIVVVNTCGFIESAKQEKYRYDTGTVPG